MSIFYTREMSYTASCIECGETIIQAKPESGEDWRKRSTEWAKAHASHERGDPNGPLTHQMARDFMVAGGGECPYCRSGAIVATEQVQLEGETGHRKVRCHDCGHAYLELYALVGVADDEGKVPG